LANFSIAIVSLSASFKYGSLSTRGVSSLLTTPSPPFDAFDEASFFARLSSFQVAGAWFSQMLPSLKIFFLSLISFPPAPPLLFSWKMTTSRVLLGTFLPLGFPLLSLNSTSSLLPFSFFPFPSFFSFMLARQNILFSFQNHFPPLFFCGTWNGGDFFFNSVFSILPFFFTVHLSG